MSDKGFNSALSEIAKTVSLNRKILDEIKKENATIEEVVNNIYQRTEDMSKKFDEVLNVGLKKPSTKTVVKKTPVKKTLDVKKTKGKSKTEPVDDTKLIKNIMTYFKTRYINDTSFFDAILEENQSDAIFAEHTEDIAAKKEGEVRLKFKSAILYKNLTPDQKKKIREKMMDEYDKATTTNESDVESEVCSDVES